MKDFLSTENNNLGKTINEVRKEQGLDPIEGGEARLPSDSITVFVRKDRMLEEGQGPFTIGATMPNPLDEIHELEDGDTVHIVDKELGIDQTGTVHLQPDGSFVFNAKEGK
ncbi:hypothetical protein [Bacillus phage SP8]|nr:hypothetical protein [Bacillus phage SP8]